MKRQILRDSNLLHLLTAAALLCGAGCGSLRPRHAVPAELVDQAHIPGLPDVRVLVQLTETNFAKLDRFLTNTVLPPVKPGQMPTMLALSGGGADGAFGAGLLCGWTEAGNRPEFDIVTGISTGALIGPYAFLGPAHDAELKSSYTTISDKDIMDARGTFSILRHRDAVASSAPLQKMLEKQVDQAKLEAIAAEYRKGRRFYVATTDLDSQRLSVWDMGAIAASGRPDAPKLFRSVLLASASIPVAFPPVYFDVEAGGKKFDEMHADGGVIAQAFGALVLKRLTDLSGRDEGRLYFIRNSQLPAKSKSVEPKLSSIAGRTVSTMIKIQGIGDIFRAYVVAQTSHLDFNLASIPPEFNVPRESEFDTPFMQALFETGRLQASKGYPWAKTPPGIPAAAAK